MLLLALTVLHAPLAHLPSPNVVAIVCQLSGSDSGSSSGSSGSLSGSSGSTTGASGSSGASGSASSSGAGSIAGSGSSTSSTTSGGSTTGSVGTQPGDGEPGTIGIPSRCNSGDDCPQNFFCTEHKCRPNSQRATGGGGCGSSEGFEWLALLFSTGLVARNRRR